MGRTDETKELELMEPGVTEALPDEQAGPESVRQFQLTVLEGPGSGTVWQSSGDTCAVGSHASNDLVIDDSTVSRFHCEIRIGADGARIRDLTSTNGTVLDGVRIFEAAPRGGSLLRIGRSTLRFEFGKAHNQLPLSTSSQFGTLVGSSVSMRTTFALLERAAASDATVLLAGETGTGKEEAARSLHAEGARADRPFVVVDCGALPEALLESELFGYERGAFTGAYDTHLGAFEAADGGTLFLDEIGESAPELQPKLLRALEAREVRRLGATDYRKVDVRVIAASNRDLRTEVNEGRFRADLYYRISVVKITLPPLRERPEDVSSLAENVLLRLGATDEQVSSLLTDELTAALKRAAWAGNVRELRNHLERCLIFEEPVPIDAPEPGSRVGHADTSMPFPDARRSALDAFERAYLTAMLEANAGNVTRAAQASGIGRVYFYRLLGRHGLKPASIK